MRGGFGHQGGEQAFEDFHVFDDGVDFIGVEGEGFFQLFKDADEIQHEAIGFVESVLIFIGAVDTGYCL